MFVYGSGSLDGVWGGVCRVSEEAVLGDVCVGIYGKSGECLSGVWRGDLLVSLGCLGDVWG